jgi:hypothetical protein
MSKAGFLPGFGSLRVAALAGAICVAGTSAMAGTASVNVTTYHYDNYRTGWNSSETVLTPAHVKRTGTTGKTFKMTSFTPLNDQVDAQPLIMTSQTIAGHGTHNVVYVATESNSIYAIDADSGKVLLKKTFGNPVPMSALPGKCSNNGPNVGITSTPVIDAGNGTMYVMVYDYDKGTTPVYRLHALDLSTLADLVTPVVVKASGKLSSGKTYNFDAAVTRQRPALLLANGHVYAGFGSFCDAANDISRGWVLGWQTGTLTPLANNELTDKLATSPDDFFLSAVWMSGYGLASGGTNGDIYFVTGNSDSGSKIRDGGVNNVAESVVQMSPDLSTVESVFTPDDSNSLDASDKDFGSGGALLLPPQTGQSSDLLVAAGKDGYMYFLNADNLDNNTTGPNRILGTYSIDNCWCGESYFTGSDGIGRIVSSGAFTVEIWKIMTGATPKLVREPGTGTVTNGGVQDPGFFTTVSTNGTTANSGVIWAVSRPDGTANENVALFAFQASNGDTLFSANAGTWPNVNGNANLVPVVANGKVYVASYEGLAIFGLSSATASAKAPVAPQVAARAPLSPGEHEIYGTVNTIDGSTIVVRKHDGTLVTVDASPAAHNHDLAPPSVGHGILARGTYNAAGGMTASVVLHAKDHTSIWLPDR